MNKQEKNVPWYNNASIVVLLLIGIIALIVLSSQSFSNVGEVGALMIVQNILNHNITYMIVFVYFVSLLTKFGKKYFDYSNLLMVVFFFVIFITSLLTLLHSFSLVTLLTFANNFLIFIYFLHTFARGTRFWKEFKLDKSAFNELGSDWYFNAIMLIEITLFAVSLISMTTVDGTFLATFDCVYVILFARYIYLYGVYLDEVGVKSSSEVENRDFLNDDEKISKDTSLVTDNISKKIDDFKEDLKEEKSSNKEKTDKDKTNKKRTDREEDK